MELLEQLLFNALSKEKADLDLEALHIYLQNECSLLLEKIKTAIENDNLTDFECIEEIVCLFEDNGCGIKNRHDFG